MNHSSPCLSCILRLPGQFRRIARAQAASAPGLPGYAGAMHAPVRETQRSNSLATWATCNLVISG